MIANHIATPKRMHANFFHRALSCNSRSAMAKNLFKLLFANSSENLGESFCGPAWRIAFHPMMHFDNFQIEAGAEYFRCFSSQPEQRIDARREIGREHDRDLRFEI